MTPDDVDDHSDRLEISRSIHRIAAKWILLSAATIGVSLVLASWGDLWVAIAILPIAGFAGIQGLSLRSFVSSLKDPDAPISVEKLESVVTILENRSSREGVEAAQRCLARRTGT
jgi:hypothetical protein